MSIYYGLKNGICCTQFSNWVGLPMFFVICTFVKSHDNAVLFGSHLF